MHTSVIDVERQIEYLEHIGAIRRVLMNCTSCKGCSGCSSGNEGMCRSCMPRGGFQNMGQMWEVV